MKRSFKVRAMAYQGGTWLCAKDAGQAIGWHPDTLRHLRRDALPGDGWGYAILPTPHGGHMMVLVSVEALAGALKDSVTRQARVFRRWLNGLDAAQRAQSNASHP